MKTLLKMFLGVVLSALFLSAAAFAATNGTAVRVSSIEFDGGTEADIKTISAKAFVRNAGEPKECFLIIAAYDNYGKLLESDFAKGSNCILKTPAISAENRILKAFVWESDSLKVISDVAVYNESFESELSKLDITFDGVSFFEYIGENFDSLKTEYSKNVTGTAIPFVEAKSNNNAVKVNVSTDVLNKKTVLTVTMGMNKNTSVSLQDCTGYTYSKENSKVYTINYNSTDTLSYDLVSDLQTVAASEFNYEIKNNNFMISDGGSDDTYNVWNNRQSETWNYLIGQPDVMNLAGSAHLALPLEAGQSRGEGFGWNENAECLYKPYYQFKVTKPSEVYVFVNSNNDKFYKEFVPENEQKLWTNCLPLSGEDKMSVYYEPGERLYNCLSVAEYDAGKTVTIYPPYDSNANGDNVSYIILVKPIDYYAEQSEIQTLSSINIKGEPIADFEPSIKNYTYEVSIDEPVVPEITVTLMDDTYSCKIENPTVFPGESIIKITKDGVPVDQFTVKYICNDTLIKDTVLADGVKDLISDIDGTTWQNWHSVVNNNLNTGVRFLANRGYTVLSINPDLVGLNYLNGAYPYGSVDLWTGSDIIWHKFTPLRKVKVTAYSELPAQGKWNEASEGWTHESASDEPYFTYGISDPYPVNNRYSQVFEANETVNMYNMKCDTVTLTTLEFFW